MASTTPTENAVIPAVASAPVVDAASVVAPVVTAPESAPVAAVTAVKNAVAKVAAKVAPRAAPAPAAVVTPTAKKKVAAKAAPKIAVKKTVKPVVRAVAKAKAVISKEETVMEAQIKNAAEKAKSMFTDANAKSNKAFGDINDFAKGNIEAIVESGKIAAKGVEAMGQDAAEYSRKQFESATAALKSLSAVKSPTDFFKLQGDYMRSAFDSMVAQTSKNTETMLKLAGEVAQPIQNRVSIAVEKVKVAA